MVQVAAQQSRIDPKIFVAYLNSAEHGQGFAPLLQQSIFKYQSVDVHHTPPLYVLTWYLSHIHTLMLFMREPLNC